MVRENPKENDQSEAGSYDDQPLIIQKDAGNADLPFHKGPKRVEGAYKPFESGNPCILSPSRMIRLTAKEEMISDVGIPRKRMRTRR